MAHTAPWTDPTTHITYQRGDPIIITGTVYEAGDATGGSWGYFSNAEFYFYSYYTADWQVNAPICIGTTAGTAWGFVEASSIVSGGTPETFTISYDANGGSGAPEDQTKEYGKAIRLSSTRPTRDGYTFGGWGNSATSATAIWQPGASYSGNADITFYAVWKPIQYTIHYDVNGGSGGPADQYKSYGESIVLSTTEPTRDGYTFSIWYGGNTSYNPGDTYSNDEDITLYALWIAKKYTVVFNANGGSGAPRTQTKTHGMSLTLPTTVPTRTGYVFKEWNTRSGGSGKSYAPGGSYTDNAPITLYAQWETAKYDVTFDATWDGGSPDTVKQVEYGKQIGLLPTATKKYYRFVGWFTAKAGGVQITGSEVIKAAQRYYAHFVIDASVHVRSAGQEKAGFPYVRSGGEWKKGYCYIRTGGSWKQGTAG